MTLRDMVVEVHLEDVIGTLKLELELEMVVELVVVVVVVEVQVLVLLCLLVLVLMLGQWKETFLEYARTRMEKKSAAQPCTGLVWMQDAAQVHTVLVLKEDPLVTVAELSLVWTELENLPLRVDIYVVYQL